MTQEKFDAKLDQVAGGIKEAAGKVTGDKRLEAEGTTEKLGGKIKEGIEDAKETVKGAIDSLLK